WENRMNRGIAWISVLVAVALLAGTSSPAAAQTDVPAAPAAPAPGDTVVFKPATPAESLMVGLGVSPGVPWSLTRCIELALQQNADVKVAHARARQAAGSALSAWSGIIPSVDAQAAYQQTRPDKFSATRVVTFNDSTTVNGLAKKQENGSISASATSNIISIPAIKEKQRRDHLRNGSDMDEAETRNLVVFQVKQQYFTLLKADRLAQVARDTERLARDEETRANALFQVGTVAKGDVLKARAHRASTQADRLQAESQAEIEASKLRQILGLTTNERIGAEPLSDTGIVMPDSADAIRQAVVTRPRIMSAKATENAARASLFGANAERLPKITGNFGVDRSKIDETITDLGGVPGLPDEVVNTRYATQWRGGVVASMPIFEGLSIEGGVRQAKGAVLEAESQRRQSELDVAVEVQQAWFLLREAVQRIDVQREGLTSAEEDYKFSKGRYDLGAGTYLDLLTAEVGLATARQNLIQALADARIAEAGLEFSIGAKRY
ncbi:MAG: TolC family protein, partial [Candidatus Eiseniibacteriota bacterium]